MICSSCKQDLDIICFSFKNKKRKKLNSLCKSCHSQYRRGHYVKNKRKYIEKAQRWNKKQGEILREYLYNILLKSKCIDCGEKDVLVLEFDHVENKKIGIAQMYKNRYSMSAVQQELKKCVVRCANCHRRKTAQESGFWKLKMSKE